MHSGPVCIEFTGLRPGEERYEELLVDNETTLPTPHAMLRIARARPPGHDGLPEEVAAWIDEAVAAGAEAVRPRLRAWIPEYTPAP